MASAETLAPPAPKSSAKESSSSGNKGVYRFNTVGGKTSDFATSERLRRDGETVNRRGEIVDTPQEERAITPELHESFSKSTEDEVNKMMERWERNPDSRAELLQELDHPDLRPFRILFENFTQIKAGSMGPDGTPMRELKKAELTKYLNTDAGFADAVEIRRIRMEEVALDSGAWLELNLDQVDPRAIDNTDSSTNPGGWAHEMFIRRFGEWMSNPRESHGRRLTNFEERDDFARGNWGANVRATIRDRWLNPRTRGGRVTSGAAYSAALAAILSPLGPLGIIGGAAIPPSVWGIMNAFRRGERVDLDKARSALAIVQASDTEKRNFGRSQWNVDVSILGINARGQVGIREGIRNNTELASPSMYFKDVQQFLLQESSMIREAEMAMSQRPEVLNAGMDVQGFGRGNEQFSQRDLSLDTQVNIQVKRELEDAAGNPCQIAVPNAAGIIEWFDNTQEYYNANQVALNAMGVMGPFNLQNVDAQQAYFLRREIRRNMLSDRMEYNIGRILEGDKDSLSDSLKLLDQRKGAYGKDSPQAKTRAKELERRSTALASSQSSIDASIAAVSNFETHIKSQRETNQQHETTITTESRKIGIGGWAPPPAAAPTPDDIVNALNQILETPRTATTVTLVGIRGAIGDLTGVSTGIETDINNALNTWRSAGGAKSIDADMARQEAALAGAAAGSDAANAAAAQISKLNARIDAREASLREKVFKSRIDRYEKQLTTVTEIRDKLQEALTAQRDYVTNVTDRFGEQRRAAEKVTTDLPQARRKFERWRAHPAVLAGGPAIDLSVNALATEDITELQRRVNEAYTRARAAVPPVADIGWPEAENNKNLQPLFDAMAEARAIRQEPRIAAPSLNFLAATNRAQYNLGELDLVTLTAQEIRDLVATRRTSGAIPAALPIPTIPVIEAVKAEAQMRLTARKEALEVVKDVVESSAMAVNQEKLRVETEGIITPEIETYERALTRYDNIGETIFAMTQQQIIELFNQNLANTRGREFLPSEQEANQSIAYVNMMNLFFDHRDISQESVQYNGQTGRDAAFRRNREYMSQDVLRDLLIEHFNLAALPFGAPATFDDAITSMQTYINSRIIRKVHLAQFFQQTVAFGYMVPRIPVL